MTRVTSLVSGPSAADGRSTQPSSGRPAVWPAFVWTSTGLALTAGFGLGGVLFATRALDLPTGGWWPAAGQAHGHLQLFGWAGLMVLGVGLHFVPRLRGAPLLDGVVSAHPSGWVKDYPAGGGVPTDVRRIL